MIFQATEEDMRIYSDLVSALSYHKTQCDALYLKLKQWEDEHSIPDDEPQ